MSVEKETPTTRRASAQAIIDIAAPEIIFGATCLLFSVIWADIAWEKSAPPMAYFPPMVLLLMAASFLTKAWLRWRHYHAERI